MSGAIRVLLPPSAAHLARRVIACGCTPVIDATGEHVPDGPRGRLGPHAARAAGPGDGSRRPRRARARRSPIARPGSRRACRAMCRAGSRGWCSRAGEAGGLCGEEDGFDALAKCPDPGSVLLDAGLGPRGAAAARALGAGGGAGGRGAPRVPRDRPARGHAAAHGPARRRDHPHGPRPARLRQRDGGPCCAASPSASTIPGPSPPPSGSTATRPSTCGSWARGLALARGLADRYGTLPALLNAYREAWDDPHTLMRAATPADAQRVVGTAAALAAPGTAATTSGTVGSGVLWEEASWLGRPVHGGPLPAAAAYGGPVVCNPDALADLQGSLPISRSRTPPLPGNGRAERARFGRGPRGRCSRRGSGEAEGAEAEAVPMPAVAIVGIGCRFPGGSTGVEAYWDNIVHKRDAIGTVPDESVGRLAVLRSRSEHSRQDLLEDRRLPHGLRLQPEGLPDPAQRGAAGRSGAADHADVRGGCAAGRGPEGGQALGRQGVRSGAVRGHPRQQPRRGDERSVRDPPRVARRGAEAVGGGAAARPAGA